MTRRGRSFVWCVALVAVLVLSSAVALAQGDGPVTLVVSRGWGGADVWERVAEGFIAEHPNVTVEMTLTGHRTDQVIVRHLAGNPFDVIFAAIEGARGLWVQDLFQPLDPFIDSDPEGQAMMRDIHPNISQVFRYDGSLYFIPWDWNNMVMWYNVPRYQSAGLAPPSSDWTWSEFLTNAQHLTELNPTDASVKAGGYAKSQNWAFFMVAPFIFSKGGRILDESWSRAVLTSEETVAAVEDLLLLGPQGYNVRGPNEAMFASGTWSWPGLVNRTGNREDWNIQLIPKSASQTTVIGMGGHGISNQTKHAQLAWEFIKWVTSKEALLTFAAAEGGNANRMYSRTSVISSPEFREMLPKDGQVFYDALASVMPLPAPPQYNEILKVFTDQMAKVEKGELDARTALLQANDVINAILAGN